MVDNCKCFLLKWPWLPHCCLMLQLLIVFISCLWPYHWLQTLIRKWSFPPCQLCPQPRGSSHLSPPEPSCLFQNKPNSKVLGSWNVYRVKAQSQEQLQCCGFLQVQRAVSADCDAAGCVFRDILALPCKSIYNILITSRNKLQLQQCFIWNQLSVVHRIILPCISNIMILANDFERAVWLWFGN